MGDIRSHDVASGIYPIDPDDFWSAVPGAAAGGARPDHCFDRPADDRRRTGRADAPLLGGHRLSAFQHGRHAALWETWRSPRPQGRAAGGDRGVPGRLCSLRTCAEHAATHSVPILQGIGGGGLIVITMAV